MAFKGAWGCRGENSVLAPAQWWRAPVDGSLGEQRTLDEPSVPLCVFSSGDISVFFATSVDVTFVTLFCGLPAMSSNNQKASTTERVIKSKSGKKQTRKTKLSCQDAPHLSADPFSFCPFSLHK